MLSTQASSPNRRVAVRSRRQQRIESEILRARGLDLLRSSAPKVLLAALVLAAAAAEFTPAARDWEGLILRYGLPPISVAVGLWRLLEAPSTLRGSALTAGSLLVLVCEITLVFGGTPATWIVFLLLGIWAAIIEAVAARRGTSARLAACAGIAIAFALYVPGRPSSGDPLETALGASFVATLAGGVPGLMAGVIARWRVGARW